MTRRSLLALFAVGPLARLLPPPPPPFVPTAVEDVVRFFDVPAHMITTRYFIEVTAFGDANPIYVTRMDTNAGEQ